MSDSPKEEEQSRYLGNKHKASRDSMRSQVREAKRISQSNTVLS